MYEGQFSEGKFKGFGRTLYPKMQYHIGHYEDNQYQGPGTECYYDHKHHTVMTREGFWHDKMFYEEDPNKVEEVIEEPEEPE